VSLQGASLLVQSGVSRFSQQDAQREVRRSRQSRPGPTCGALHAATLAHAGAQGPDATTAHGTPWLGTPWPGTTQHHCEATLRGRGSPRPAPQARALREREEKCAWVGGSHPGCDTHMAPLAPAGGGGGLSWRRTVGLSFCSVFLFTSVNFLWFHSLLSARLAEMRGGGRGGGPGGRLQTPSWAGGPASPSSAPPPPSAASAASTPPPPLLPTTAPGLGGGGGGRARPRGEWLSQPFQLRLHAVLSSCASPHEAQRFLDLLAWGVDYDNDTVPLVLILHVPPSCPGSSPQYVTRHTPPALTLRPPSLQSHRRPPPCSDSECLFHPPVLYTVMSWSPQGTPVSQAQAATRMQCAPSSVCALLCPWPVVARATQELVKGAKAAAEAFQWPWGPVTRVRAGGEGGSIGFKRRKRQGGCRGRRRHVVGGPGAGRWTPLGSSAQPLAP